MNIADVTMGVNQTVAYKYPPPETSQFGAGNETRTRDFHLGKVENRVSVIQKRPVSMGLSQKCLVKYLADYPPAFGQG